MSRRSLEWFIKKYGQELGSEKFNRNDRFLKREKHEHSNSEQDVLNGDAVKCLACNKILGRIQHTHLRNKCIGEFGTVQKYLEKYPGAEVVPKNLAKLTAPTKKKFDTIYGNSSEMKWGTYTSKQRETNSLHYKQEHHGFSESDFKNYNKSRGVTLENLVKKHGVELGTEKFEQYRLRQQFTTSEEYFIQKYGQELGIRKFNAFMLARVSSTKSKPEKELFDFVKTLDSRAVHQMKVQGVKGCFDIAIQNKLIEFYGDFWHGNPLKYSADEEHKIKKCKIHEVWNYDKNKITSAQKLGYNVLVIWENEWKRERSISEQKVIDFIMGESI